MGTTHPKVKLSNPLLFSNFGIATAQIGDNNFGVVTTLGFLFVVDTSLWANNTLLYSTAIGDLSVVPLGSPVAFVVKQDANCGVLYVLAIGDLLVNSSGIGNPIYTEDVKISEKTGEPKDLNNLKEWLNHIWSVGITAGANITDNGNGTVNISEATALLRHMSLITITSVGFTATVTAPLHNLETGEFIYVEGAIQSAYNGSWAVTVVNPNIFTYTLLSTTSSPATGTIYFTAEHATLIPTIVPGVTNLTLTDHSVNYIYSTLNGFPQFNVLTSPIVIGAGNKAIAYTVSREGNTLYILDGRLMNVDAIQKAKARSIETERFKIVLGGSAVGQIGTRNISVTSGAFYYGLSRIPHASFDTSTIDTFTYCYRNGAGGFTYVPGSTQITNTLYDNGTGTLGAITGNNYLITWVYMMNDSPSRLLVQYGQDDYPNISSAQTAPVPVVPSIVLGVGVLIARIIVRKSEPTFIEIASPFTTPFQPSIETNHEMLAGLLGGATLEHYHLTATQHTVATQLSSSILTGLLSPTDWTNFNSKQTSALTSSNILVGNASNIASSAVMSGDTTISNTGVVFLKNTGTAGTYDSVTTDAQGRVTAGTNNEWHVLGKTQLTVAANATSIITIPPRTMLRVTCIVTGYSGGGIASLRFGTVAGAVDTGNNYNTRFLRAATGAPNSFTDVPTTTTNFLRLASQNIVLGRQYTVNITNYPTVRKMCSISTSSEAGAVGVAPTLDWGQGMYANNTAQIITIQLISTANNLSIGSGFIVEGVDLI